MVAPSGELQHDIFTLDKNSPQHLLVAELQPRLTRRASGSFLCLGAPLQPGNLGASVDP